MIKLFFLNPLKLPGGGTCSVLKINFINYFRRWFVLPGTLCEKSIPHFGVLNDRCYGVVVVWTSRTYFAVKIDVGEREKDIIHKISKIWIKRWFCLLNPLKNLESLVAFVKIPQGMCTSTAFSTSEQQTRVLPAVVSTCATPSPPGWSPFFPPILATNHITEPGPRFATRIFILKHNCFFLKDKILMNH